MTTNQDIRVAIIVATYRRQNGSTIHNLQRVADMLNKQTYQNYHLFLMGDDYTDKDEFNKIVTFFPSDKIYAQNMPTSYRDGVFKDRHNMWAIGGINATYYGLLKAIELGYKYYFHLDDDDGWLPNHIETIVNTIKEYPEVDMLYTRSKYQNKYLPGNVVDISYNNLPPRGGKLVNASSCINLETLSKPLLELFDTNMNRVERIRKKEIPEGRFVAFDFTKWEMINKLVISKDSNIKTIYIPILTCNKDSDKNLPLRDLPVQNLSVQDLPVQDLSVQNLPSK